MELLEWVTECDVDGLTISGGEPLQQLQPVLELGEAVRALGQSVVIFTGYQKQYVESVVSWKSLEKSCDVLIAGPYISKLHLAEGLRGSLNKEYVFLSGRYSAESFGALNDAEITIDREGHIHVTGMTVPVFGLSKAKRGL
jgi:anaerobic ribonucleoside-triphosphate reductase activating protein